MYRRKLITLIGCLAIAWPLVSYAQQPKQPLKHVGLLAQNQCPLKPDNPIVRRLGELGWVEGQTIVFDCVSAFGRVDQVPGLARELVSWHPDVLMAGPFNYISALKQETTTIPIVMLAGWEPIRMGFITSLAQPGGNVTGVAWFGLLPKQMELLKEIVPNLLRVAYIAGVQGAAYSPPETFKIAEEDRQTAASALGFTWKVFARLSAEHFDAVYIPNAPVNRSNLSHICQLALRHRFPAVSETSDWVKCGLLLSYGQDGGVDFTDMGRRSAGYVDKILKGAKPADLPVEQPTKFEMVINLKTAKALGLTAAPSLLARADEVIE
jgi:putative tryptophan/tyrosine transport system substrate-binding protein